MCSGAATHLHGFCSMLNLPVDSITNISSDCTPALHNPVGAFRRKADNRYEKPDTEKMDGFLGVAIVLSTLFSGCNNVKHPIDGQWASEDGNLIVSYEKTPYVAILTKNGEQSLYLFGVEHGTTEIELYTPNDGILIGQGKILSYNEIEWIINICGEEYHLYRVPEPSY